MNKILALILFLGFSTHILGCSPEKFGTEIKQDAPLTKIKEILTNPSMDGKVINLEGTIVTQCLASGCWFILQDETGHIFVSTNPNGPNDPNPPPFTLPPRTGKRAKVTGTVRYSSGTVYLIAKGVEIR